MFVIRCLLLVMCGLLFVVVSVCVVRCLLSVMYYVLFDVAR